MTLIMTLLTTGQQTVILQAVLVNDVKPAKLAQADDSSCTHHILSAHLIAAAAQGFL